MRIVFFTGVIPTSPALTRRAGLVAKNLMRRGHSVRILCLSTRYYTAGREAIPAGLDIECVGQYHHDARYRRKSVLLYIPEVFRIAARTMKIISAYRPHAVHIFTAHPSSLVLLILLRIAGYRVCFDVDDLNSAQATAAGYGGIAARIYAVCERTVPRMAWKVTVCSRYLRRMYPGAILLPNMYEKENFVRNRVTRSRASHRTTVAYLGMMGFYHGEQWIIRLIPAILRKNEGIRFLFIGWGEGENRARGLVSRLGVGKYVRFTGRLSYRRAVRRLSGADIGLLPMEDAPLYRARHPLKMVDYMAAGVCCVASKVGEAERFIHHGVTGILVPPGDGKAMVDAILYLADHPHVRKRIARAGRKSVTRLAVERQFGRWMKLYGTR